MRSAVPERSCAVALAIAALIGVAPAAAAYPVVVRAGSRLELSMRHEGTRMAIDGRLVRDDGTAIGDARVLLTVGQGEAASLQTGQDGRFGWAAELPFGEYDVVASWSGLEDVEGCDERRRFEFGRADVALDLAVPAQIDRARATVELEVRARSEVGAAGLALVLSDRGGRPLARGVTNATGLARLSVAPRTLGPPGPVRLAVRTAPDALRSAGQDVADTMLVSRSRLAVAPLPESVPADGEITVLGTLADEERPIARGAVEIVVGRAPAVRTSTDARGVFAATLPFEGLPRGALDLTVTYEPDAAWRLPATVGPLSIRHLPPTPLPVWLLLVPVLVTALALVALVRSARDRRGAARRARAQPPPARLQGGLAAARPSESRARASRRPPDPEIAGRVWDPTQRRGIAGATVTVTVGGEDRALSCDAGGRFATGPLPAGEVTVQAEADGYLPESFVARVPHQGELRDVRIELVPVRHRVMEIYRDAALKVLPERDLWGFWTPRELLRFVKKRQEARQMPLAPLTELFEEVYYAGRRANAEHVARATELAGTVGVRAPQ